MSASGPSGPLVNISRPVYDTCYESEHYPKVLMDYWF